MIHCNFRTKEKLYELVFTDFVKTLFTELNQNKLLKSHPYEQGIDYPELFEIAWFIANEFRSNKQLAQSIIKKNTELRSVFETAYKTNDWVSRFHNLITAQLKDIFIKNRISVNN